MHLDDFNNLLLEFKNLKEEFQAFKLMTEGRFRIKNDESILLQINDLFNESNKLNELIKVSKVYIDKDIREIKKILEETISDNIRNEKLSKDILTKVNTQQLRLNFELTERVLIVEEKINIITTNLNNLHDVVLQLALLMRSPLLKIKQFFYDWFERNRRN